MKQFGPHFLPASETRSETPANTAPAAHLHRAPAQTAPAAHRQHKAKTRWQLVSTGEAAPFVGSRGVLKRAP